MSLLPNAFPQIISAAFIIIICAYYFIPCQARQKPSGPFRKSAERIPDGHNRKVIPADDGLSALLAGGFELGY